ncbi:MAG: hypothetical protein EBU49_10390, partial [Proteobacteria bacterium]|nr:hypothetical protein [Pseudomonadota bacterium]
MSSDKQLKKSNLISQLLSAIDAECVVLNASVKAVVDAATNEESKAENQYDTRGLEASYLAGAQSERLAELHGIRLVLAAMPLREFTNLDAIATGAVIEMDCDGTRSRCFLLHHAAGYTLQIPGDGQPGKTISTSLTSLTSLTSITSITSIT